MKKFLLPVTVGCFLFSGHSNAASVSAQVGKDFTELAAGIGGKGAGLGINGNWARSDHDGQVVSLGATFGLPLGPFSAYIGGKAYYLSPQDNNNGFAFAAGVGANWQIMPSLALYGEIYGSPRDFTSGNYAYQEADVGIKYEVIKPLAINFGYRFIKLQGKSQHPNNTIADGFYLGAGVSF